MKNQGISLISLIITIIVIIILAAIVIFSGMDTPERAQLANFGQQVSNVSSAIVDQLTGASTEFATEGKTRNTEQIYYRLATGLDVGQFGTMQGEDVTDHSGDNGANDTNCQRINPEYAARKTSDAKKGLGITLPKVRETNIAWYVTEDGKVFNATGFVSGGKTYFTADLYTEDDTTMTSSDINNTYEERAEKIAAELIKGTTGKISIK